MGAIAPAAAQFGSLGGMHPAPANGFFGWLLGQQAFFYQALAGTIRAAKTDDSAYWALMGISFVYGVFHAAGPGHGKAVISSYLLANEETWRRGVTLSFASAVLQSLTAITIVAIAALLIGVTAKMMGDTVRSIEMVSYALIILVGARLMWVKTKSFGSTLHKVRAGANRRSLLPLRASAPKSRQPMRIVAMPVATSTPIHTIITRTSRPITLITFVTLMMLITTTTKRRQRHALGPRAWAGARGIGWAGRLAARIVGDRGGRFAAVLGRYHRPGLCLAQGLFLAGVASTFVMGLGTAITVGSIASLAVGAKSLGQAAFRPGAAVTARWCCAASKSAQLAW